MISRALRPIFLLYFFTLVQLPEAKPQKGKKDSLTARGAAEMWYSSFDEYQRLTEPTFDNNTVVNNTVQLGGTAFLHCRVRNLGERTITWVRRRDWHILTSGMFTYTNDERFQVLHAEGSEDWTLQIKYVQKRDNGTYECQVATSNGIMSHFVNLEIVVPEAFIVGAADYHVVLGGTISLVCVIEKSPTPPQYVLWYHNSKMINYDTTRGGVQVRTEQGQKTESHLTIHEAKDSDSGNYTCSASNTQPAYIHVFVSDGDKMAAISRRKSSSSGPIISAAVWYIALPVLLHRVAASRSKQTEEGRWVLAEIVCTIFSFLDDTDLLAASGVSQQWYQVAAYVLKKRGKTLYRWPDDPPSSASTLCIVGDKGISNALQSCKGIKTLEISYDEPNEISTNVIKQITYIEVNKLLLRNILLNCDNAKELLKSEIPVVEIHTKRKSHLSRRSRRLLLENKELFGGLVISSDEPASSMIGIYPNPICPNRCDTRHYRKVSLEATGLSNVWFGETLTCLRVSKAYKLKDRDLLQLSALNLKQFSVVECNISEGGWSTAFQDGFQHLTSLSLIDCPYLGLETVRHIATKSFLRFLKLDLRKLQHVAQCISFLQDTVSLVKLNLICVGASDFSECMFLEKKWKKLKKIVLTNQDHKEMKKTLLNNLIEKYKALNIVLTYYNNYTIGCTTFMISKELMSRIPI